MSILLIQNLVKKTEFLLNRNERLDKEVHGLLNTIRDLERENNSIKDRLTKRESLLVNFFLLNLKFNYQSDSRFAAVILDGDGMLVNSFLRIRSE